MKGIFISYSTANKDLAESMVELFQSGMGIGRERIFCTAISSALPTGRDFLARIRNEIKESDIVVAIITPEYLKSPFCMMELGAAWIISAGLYPILADGVNYEDLDNTPLKSIQLRKCEKAEDWFAVYDEFLAEGIVKRPETSRISKKIPEFIDSIKLRKGRDLILKADRNGYYEACIEYRRNVPEAYRCYKINGLLDLPELEEDRTKDAGHWIFFKAGAYDDLNEKERVRIKVGSTELKEFKDIGYARNIYPDELEVK